jgi:hypothetical protein
MVKSGLFGMALALTVTAVQAEADKNSANFVMVGCRSYLNSFGADPYREGHCVGFIDATITIGGGFKFAPAAAAAAPFVCLNVPAGATLAQGVRIVVAYIEARPARMHEPFIGLALEALRDAWPCK